MSTTQPLKQSAVLWGLASVVLSILFCTVNSSPTVVYAGFFAKVLAVIVGAVIGTVFTLIADAIRRAIHPDMIITNGGFFSLLGTKLFWAVGPQLIALVVGVALGIVLVLR